MSSISIDRDEYPGKSDAEIAETIAKKHGYIAIVRYKSSANAPKFTNFGMCEMAEQIGAYLNSPYCHSAEVIYDGRASALHITEELILNGRCELCGKRASRDTLQLGAGNDFYVCPKCALMCCDGCYVRLPLTSSPGYGTCPKCRVEVQRALPGFYGRQSGAPASKASATANTQAESPPAVTLEDNITLHQAIIQADIVKVRAIVARGDDLQKTDDDGATPLHYAADMRHSEIAKILLQSGARVDAQNAKGRTPLHEVVGHRHGEGDEATIEALLDAGASLDARDNIDATPLHLAAMGGHYEAAKILLDRGAKLQAMPQQLTPLHYSAYAGKPKLTQLLIDRGADVFAEKDGMNPLYFAQQPSQSSESDKRAVVKMLEQAMARAKPAQPIPSTLKTKAPKRADSNRAAKQTKDEPVKEPKKWWQFWR